MKNNMCFKLSLLILLVFLGFSNGIAQTKGKRKSGVPNLKTTIEFITAKIKSKVNYLDSKENDSCVNQITRTLSYEQAIFSNPNLLINFKDDLTRSVCSFNSVSKEKINSTSVLNDEMQISIPLNQLDAAAITSGSCRVENNFERKEGSCFFVNLEIIGNSKTIKIEKINSFKVDEKQVSDKQKISYTTNQFQIYFSDNETADKVAKALAQAIKLSGGRN